MILRKSILLDLDFPVTEFCELRPYGVLTADCDGIERVCKPSAFSLWPRACLRGILPIPGRYWQEVHDSRSKSPREAGGTQRTFPAQIGWPGSIRGSAFRHLS